MSAGVVLRVTELLISIGSTDEHAEEKSIKAETI